MKKRDLKKVSEFYVVSLKIDRKQKKPVNRNSTQKKMMTLTKMNHKMKKTVLIKTSAVKRNPKRRLINR